MSVGGVLRVVVIKIRFSYPFYIERIFYEEWLEHRSAV